MRSKENEDGKEQTEKEENKMRRVQHLLLIPSFILLADLPGEKK